MNFTLKEKEKRWEICVKELQDEVKEWEKEVKELDNKLRHLRSKVNELESSVIDTGSLQCEVKDLKYLLQEKKI